LPWNINESTHGSNTLVCLQFIHKMRNGARWELFADHISNHTHPFWRIHKRTKVQTKKKGQEPNINGHNNYKKKNTSSCIQYHSITEFYDKKEKKRKENQ